MSAPDVRKDLVLLTECLKGLRFEGKQNSFRREQTLSVQLFFGVKTL